MSQLHETAQRPRELRPSLPSINQARRMEPGRSPHIQSLLLSIFLLLISTTNPVLGQDPLRYNLNEEIPRGHFIADLVSDANLTAGLTPEQVVQMNFDFLPTGQSGESFFDLDRQTAQLRTAQRIDRDVICPYEAKCDMELNVQASSPTFRIIKVLVSILDVNDNTPVFNEDRYVKSLPESTRIGTSLSLPIADDPDGPEFGVHHYELVGNADVFALQGDTQGGADLRLLLVGNLDREQTDIYTLTLMAFDGGTPPRTGSTIVEIQVTDVNDNNPRFQNETYDVTVSEDTARGTTILTVSALDPDAGINGEIQYGFSERTEAAHGDKFLIDQDSGDIVVVGVLDHEEARSYLLSVTARNKQPDSLATQAKVNVHVTDLNDNTPLISVKTILVDGTLLVPENVPNGTFVAHIGVSDADSGVNGDFSCSIDSVLFHLEELYATDFKMVTAASFDREEQDLYEVYVICTDTGSPPQTSRRILLVAIEDKNDESPTFNPEIITVSMEESNTRGAHVTKVRATDGDTGDNARLTYNLTDDMQDIFSIDPRSGDITVNVVLDREETREVNLTVTATDHGSPQRTGTALVVIHVTDVDDQPPVFTADTYPFSLSENRPAGTIVGRVYAVDDDRPPHNEFIYMIDENTDMSHQLFTIDPALGYIRTAAPLDREQREYYRLTVSARSSTSSEFASHAFVDVNINDENDNAPEWIFPSASNDTLYVDISTVLPGANVGRLEALDRDAGDNDVCEYGFVNDVSDETQLLLNTRNGSLVLGEHLDMLKGEDLKLEVIAYDCGTPRRNSSHVLIMEFIDGAYQPVVDKHTKENKNLVIVVVIVVVTAVVAVVLALLILHVVRHRRKLERKYNWMARMADQRIRESKASIVRATSEDSVVTSSDQAGGDDNDAVKVAMGLGIGLEGVSEERTIEGEESRPKENGKRVSLGMEEPLSPFHEVPYYNPPQYIPVQRVFYQPEHTVRKPAVFNPNPDQRVSPAGESDFSGAADSGRGSTVSEGSPHGAQWPGRDDELVTPPPPVLPLPTWDLSPGIHAPSRDINRLPAPHMRSSISSSQSSPAASIDRLVARQLHARASNSSIQSSPAASIDRLVARQPHVRFTLPPELVSLASTCSDDCLNEKEI